MRAVARFAVTAITLVLAACASSVRVLQPPKSPTSVPNPVTFTVEFHARANISAFAAQLDGADITSSFTIAGNQATAVSPNASLTAGDHVLHVRADMSPGQAFDTLGFDWRFRVQAPPPGPPPPPQPSFSVRSVTPATQSAAWGQTATYTVDVEGQNGFAGTVTLTLDNPPTGLQGPSPSPSVSVTAASPQQSSAFTVGSAAVGTRPGNQTLRLRASSPMAAVQTRTFTLGVQRTPGTFTQVSLSSSTTTCGSVTANVTGTGSGAGVQFQTSSGNTNAIRFSSGFAMSPQCRVGIVIPPATAGFFGLVAHNLGMSTATGAVPIPRQITNVTGISAVFTNYYFSPDDTLLVLIGPGGPATPQAQSATLHDMVTGNAIGAPQFFTGAIGNITLAGDRVEITGTTPTGASFSVRWTL